MAKEIFDQDRERPGCYALGAGHDPGTKDRRPERHQGAGNGEPDPAEQVDYHVRDQDPDVPRLGRVPGQQDAERGANGEEAGGGHVVAHDRGEPGRQRRTELAGEVPGTANYDPELAGHLEQSENGAESGNKQGSDDGGVEAVKA